MTTTSARTNLPSSQEARSSHSTKNAPASTTAAPPETDESTNSAGTNGVAQNATPPTVLQQQTRVQHDHRRDRDGARLHDRHHRAPHTRQVQKAHRREKRREHGQRRQRERAHREQRGLRVQKQAQSPVDPAQIQKQARDARNKQREPCDEAEIDDARFGTHRRPLDVGARAERLPDQHEVGKRAGHDGPRPRSAKEQVEHNEHAEHPCPSPRTRNGAATRCRRPMAGGFAAPGVRKNRRRRSAPHPGPPNASPSMAQKAPLGYDTVS